MKRYLSNIDLSDKERCIQAAQRSGLPITFEPSPMPIDPTNPETLYYRPENFVGTHGCIVLNGENQDCSAFWREWDALA